MRFTKRYFAVTLFRPELRLALFHECTPAFDIVVALHTDIDGRFRCGEVTVRGYQ